MCKARNKQLSLEGFEENEDDEYEVIPNYGFEVGHYRSLKVGGYIMKCPAHFRDGFD